MGAEKMLPEGNIRDYVGLGKQYEAKVEVSEEGRNMSQMSGDNIMSIK